MTSAADLLAIWDGGQGLSPLRRARMLSQYGAGAPANEEEPSIGVANARMFALRRALFGSQLVGLAACPSCGADLEIAARVEDFLAVADQTGGAARHEIEIGGRAVSFRLLTLADLAAIGDATLAETAARELLRACVAEPADAAPDATLDVALDVAGEAVLARMAALDPLADAMLELSCEACGGRFEQAFDIASFLWREIEAWAARTLADVHTIARSYGWSETDILAMSPARRQAYIDLIGT
jgi:hypothetical protein